MGVAFLPGRVPRQQKRDRALALSGGFEAARGPYGYRAPTRGRALIFEQVLTLELLFCHWRFRETSSGFDAYILPHVPALSTASIACIPAPKLAGPTADTQRTSAMRKLGVRKTALLTRWAIKLRISGAKDTLTPAEKRNLKRKRDGWNQLPPNL